MWWIVRAVILVTLLFWPQGARADDLTPHRVHVRVVDATGNLYPVAEIGCAVSDYPPPTSYTAVVECTQCAEAFCVFDAEAMRPAEGAYIRTGWGNSPPWVSVKQNPTSAVYGQMLYNGDWHLFGMWYTNAGGAPNDWETIHEATFVVSATYATPTPIPTLTPAPTPTPPAEYGADDIGEGFSEGFSETFGRLSGAGILPDFGATSGQWLFYARRLIMLINRGNLLYVVGGILMAGLVLGWAIEQVKNPR